MQKAVNFNDAATVKGNDYRINFWYMSKDDVIDIMKNSDLKKVGYYKFVFITYIKMSETTYHQRNRETILNRAKEYYQNNKERLRQQAKSKYRKLSDK